MEFVQELLVTAIVAVVFSFVVAKLVSLATASDDHRELGLKSSDGERVLEEVKFDGGLRVRSSGSERKVRFVDDVQKVDEFERQGSVEKSEELRCGDGLEVRRCDSAVICDAAGRIEVVELSVNSQEGRLTTEEAVAEIVGGNEGDLIKEEVAVTNLDGLGEIDGVSQEKTAVTDLVLEERTAQNADADSKVDSGSASDQGVEVRDEERRENQESGIEEGLNEGDEKEGVVGDEVGDDWEGIERSELEEAFATAANYVASEGKGDDRLSNLGSDIQMQLYGLHKVAMEGPCHESQPMALMVNSRAKWNAWQRLGNMNPEVAMEQYIALLSEKVPGWTESKSSRDDNSDSSESGIHAAPSPSISANPHNQLNSTETRELGLNSGTDGVV